MECHNIHYSQTIFINSTFAVLSWWSGHQASAATKIDSSYVFFFFVATIYMVYSTTLYSGFENPFWPLKTVLWNVSSFLVTTTLHSSLCSEPCTLDTLCYVPSFPLCGSGQAMAPCQGPLLLFTMFLFTSIWLFIVNYKCIMNEFFLFIFEYLYV